MNDELLDRAVAALVREWGISPTEARAAIKRLREQEARLGREIAREHAWTIYPKPRGPVEVDLRAPAVVR